MDSFPTNQILCVKFSMHKLGSQGESQPNVERASFPTAKSHPHRSEANALKPFAECRREIQQPKSHSSLIRRKSMKLRRNQYCPIHRSLSCCGRERIPKARTLRLGVQR